MIICQFIKLRYWGTEKNDAELFRLFLPLFVVRFVTHKRNRDSLNTKKKSNNNNKKMLKCHKLRLEGSIPLTYRAPQPITVYLATTMTMKDVPNAHNAPWDMV